MELKDQVQQIIEEEYESVEISENGLETIKSIRELFETTTLTVDEIAAQFDMTAFDLRVLLAVAELHNV